MLNLDRVYMLAVYAALEALELARYMAGAQDVTFSPMQMIFLAESVKSCKLILAELDQEYTDMARLN